MGREAKKYLAYARECVRQAEAAASAERRDKLMELARVWMTAALSEQALASAASDYSPACAPGV
jgi:hypothetical protein